MSYVVNILRKREGDKCPACYSTDVKRPKGVLVKNGKSWGLKCTVCKFTQIFKTSNFFLKRKKK